MLSDSILKAVLLALFIVNSEAFEEFSRHKNHKNKSCQAEQNDPWSYNGNNGPSNWGEKYEACNGTQQSPIEINTLYAVKNETLAPLVLSNYDLPISKATIENNGHTAEVIPQDNVNRTVTLGGKIYTFVQLHFHWGCECGNGSEHVLDGQSYSIEMHLVHMDKDNKIAVTAVMFEERKKDNPEMQKIVGELRNVKHNDTEAEFHPNLTLSKLLPDDPTSFCRYNGSLTTPGCSEGVAWTVFTNPIYIGKHQMKKFRDLHSTTESTKPGCKLCGNNRPTQPLNGRQVHCSK